MTKFTSKKYSRLHVIDRASIPKMDLGIGTKLFAPTVDIVDKRKSSKSRQKSARKSKDILKTAKIRHICSVPKKTCSEPKIVVVYKGKTYRWTVNEKMINDCFLNNYTHGNSK